MICQMTSSADGHGRSRVAGVRLIIASWVGSRRCRAGIDPSWRLQRVLDTQSCATHLKRVHRPKGPSRIAALYFPILPGKEKV